MANTLLIRFPHLISPSPSKYKRWITLYLLIDVLLKTLIAMLYSFYIYLYAFSSSGFTSAAIARHASSTLICPV